MIHNWIFCIAPVQLQAYSNIQFDINEKLNKSKQRRWQENMNGIWNVSSYVKTVNNSISWLSWRTHTRTYAQRTHSPNLTHYYFILNFFFSLNGFLKELLAFFACIHYICSCDAKKLIIWCGCLCACVELVLLDRFPKPFHGFKWWKLLYEIILSLARAHGLLPPLSEKEKEQNDEKRRRRVKKRYKTLTNSTSVTVDDDDVLRWVRAQEEMWRCGVFCCVFLSFVGSFWS